MRQDAKSGGPPPRGAEVIFPDWSLTNGTYLTGVESIGEMDRVAAEMEAKWGCDRLRLLVPLELRERFDRQRLLVNQAIWHGELEDLRQATARMVKAWRAADRAAEAAGAGPLVPEVWECSLSSGVVVAVVRTDADMQAVRPDGRAVAVWSLEELVRMIEAFPDLLAKAKASFPGITVTKVGMSVSDPLQAVPDTSRGLDKRLDDPIPF